MGKDCNLHQLYNYRVSFIMKKHSDLLTTLKLAFIMILPVLMFNIKKLTTSRQQVTIKLYNTIMKLIFTCQHDIQF